MISCLFKNLLILVSRIVSNAVFSQKLEEEKSGVDHQKILWAWHFWNRDNASNSCFIHLLNSLGNRGDSMYFESYTNFGGISSGPWAEPDLKLSIQEFTSASQIFGNAKD